MRTNLISYAGIGDEAGASLRTQLDALARLSWSQIELRTVDGTWIADLGDRAFTQLTDTLATQELTVAGVASRIGNWSRPITGAFDRDLDELAVLSHRCAALGTRYIRVMSYLNAGLGEHEWRRRAVYRMRELASRAEEAGLVLLHENCTGWAATNTEHMLDLLDAVGSPALRLLFDTGNGIAHGYQAYDMLTQIVTHVAHVHIKDAKGSATNPVYTLPGAGQARVADCLRLLLRSGYTGVWSIEPHLTLRPHAGAEAGHAEGDKTGQGCHDGFVASGLALEQLVRNQVLPAFPAWMAVPGGLRRA
ncbi:MAG TPA: sugar phosphate isomerase/epimerase family protein [Pseudonocardiaceae bacterium]|nr:sugar phosphate isomerase/epimerase family protein [Pseudonocardiaceae bacterium]